MSTEDKAQATDAVKLTAKDFASDQDVRWCPGCGDYSILAQVQRTLPSLGIKRENIVWVAGIGCSSRFPYYMSTYGFHGIHGRALAIASGLKSAHPDLSVWVATGDGDCLSIGGNHFLHAMRRNIDVNVVMFNNQIYGLTKGQYSPTSEYGKKTRSTPFGAIDHPVNPILMAIGAESTFVARTMDRDPKHMQEMISRAAAHKGVAFLDVLQNCNIFNDGAFEQFTDKKQRPETTVYLEHGKPLVFGKDDSKGIKLDGLTPRIVDLGEHSKDDLLVHNEKDPNLAAVLGRMVEQPGLPMPFGVFLAIDRKTYDGEMRDQIELVTEKKGQGDLKALFNQGRTWVIDEQGNPENN
ncbi:MAG: 2-oxoacid:ferredoxin oxidoreductase subunit beta [Ectothiorhodospiraceae bacterium]|nr:2-oxoacid:ferredoxin oxidoreductase subunit beta [Ectothiorhodospiraceae bacterium]